MKEEIKGTAIFECMVCKFVGATRIERGVKVIPCPKCKGAFVDRFYISRYEKEYIDKQTKQNKVEEVIEHLCDELLNTKFDDRKVEYADAIAKLVSSLNDKPVMLKLNTGGNVEIKATGIYDYILQRGHLETEAIVQGLDLAKKDTDYSTVTVMINNKDIANVVTKEINRQQKASASQIKL